MGNQSGLLNLAAWLEHIQQQHPTEIELGLERTARVAIRLGLTDITAKIISVAGTNGKGSCVALLEALLSAHNYKVGCYTSPHLHHYNERIKIQSEAVSDAAICEAFEHIERAREDTPLTYFEYGTLAALLLFKQAELDVVILEVGLGGRLDAVNILDADVAVITSIGLDHTDWLGTDRESIGFEKAGIFRSEQAVVCAEPEPPLSMLAHAKSLDAQLHLINKDFGMEEFHHDMRRWWGVNVQKENIAISPLETAALHQNQAAAAIQALVCLDFKLEQELVSKVLNSCVLPGRFELIDDQRNATKVLFDVAHNPAAAALLHDRLKALKAQEFPTGKIIAVLAMMADKDSKGFCQALDSVVEIWYITQVDHQRTMSAHALDEQLRTSLESAQTKVFDNTGAAYREACKAACSGDLILVTGSFYTVSEIRGKLLG